MQPVCLQCFLGPEGGHNICLQYRFSCNRYWAKDSFIQCCFHTYCKEDRCPLQEQSILLQLSLSSEPKLMSIHIIHTMISIVMYRITTQPLTIPGAYHYACMCSPDPSVSLKISGFGKPGPGFLGGPALPDDSEVIVYF